jgi:hypothetical protein
VQQAIVKAQSQSFEPEDQIEGILFDHGERIAGQLLDALRADDRFVRLAGRWFLGGLAKHPSDAQLTALAWTMFEIEEPQPTEALLPLLPPPVPQGDPGLFGLYLALRGQPERFTNADPGQRPRWLLAGPPAGPVSARYVAYDPESYQVLCRAGEALDQPVAKRLWDLNLFRTVCQA